jgi:glutaredoxin
MKNLVIYSASWCNPCQQLKKTLELVDLGIPVNIIDIDKDPVSATENAIRGVPTMLLINDNVVMRRKSGYVNAEQLKEFIA